MQIPQAKGLNTYAARGSTDQPLVLHNALLRPGGWACAPKATLLASDITRAVWTGLGTDLYVEPAAGNVYRRSLTNPGILPGLEGLAGAVTLAPDLVQVGATYLTGLSSTDTSLPPPITFWDGTGPAPAGEYYSFAPATVSSITYRVVTVRGPDALGPPSPWNGVLEFTTSHPVTFGNLTHHYLLYEKGQNATKFGSPKTNVDAGGELTSVFEPPLFSAPATDHVTFTPRMAAYYGGRIYLTANTLTRMDPTATPPVTTTTPPLNRLYYSDHIFSFSPDGLPFFAEDYWIDIPFRVSRGITGVKTAGRYLYVFGENEVMILQGSSDQDWSVEQLADSIGAVRPTSIQTLQNAVIYLSDTSVLMITGGQVVDIGLPVQDLALALNINALSSTVDFKREIYYLTDRVTTLAYHYREQGWSTRQVDGAEQRLEYAGGVPFSVHRDLTRNLYSLDSEDLLPMTVTLGPFGQPGQRRTWRGVTGAVDASGVVDVTSTLKGFDTDMDGLPVLTPDSSQTRHFTGDHLTPLVVSHTPTQAAVMSATVTLTPAAGVTRCMLRPPLTLLGSEGTEAWA